MMWFGAIPDETWETFEKFVEKTKFLVNILLFILNLLRGTFSYRLFPIYVGEGEWGSSPHQYKMPG